MAQNGGTPNRGRITIAGIHIHPVVAALGGAALLLICGWLAFGVMGLRGGATTASAPASTSAAAPAARSLAEETTAAPQPTIAFNTPTPLPSGKRMIVEGVSRDNATMLPRWYYQDASIVGAYTFTRIDAEGQPAEALVFGPNDWLLLGNKSEVEVLSNYPNSVVKIRIINNTIEPERSNGKEVYLKGWIISGDLTVK